jgi:uncharacterized OB-fold protein
MSEVEIKYIPIKEDFFSKPLYPLENVRLMGSRCCACGEVIFGKGITCQQCQGEDMQDIVLSPYGKLYSYTIIRNKPPGDYKGPEPFEPFPVGLVELPEGIRILAPLTGCRIEELKNGMELELSIEEFYEDEDGRKVLIFRFKPRRIEKGGTA